MVIDGDKNHPVVPQEIPCEKQAWIHHIHPLGVEASVGFGICAEFSSACIHLPRVGEVGIQALGVVIRVDELIAGIVGWVDVDHLHLAQVAFLQKLERFEIVALDDEVFSGVEVHRLLAAGPERRAARSLDRAEALRLARPVHAIAFLAGIHHLAQRGFQPVKVHLAALGDRFGEELPQFFPLPGGYVERGKVEFFGVFVHFLEVG